jgi:hypothetical protein
MTATRGFAVSHERDAVFGWKADALGEPRPGEGFKRKFVLQPPAGAQFHASAAK